MIWIWVAVFCGGLLMELVQAGTLVSVWFSVGAVIPFFMSLWPSTEPWYICVQILVFGIVTILSLIFLRKVAQKTLFRNSKETTNLDTTLGKKTKIVSNEKGKAYIKLNDVEYRAVSVNEEDDLQVGETVEIIKFSGNKVIVKEVSEEEKEIKKTKSKKGKE